MRIRPLVLAAAVVGASLLGVAAAADAADTGVNLNGQFRVREVVTSTYGVPGIFPGAHYRAVWTFAPTCQTGSCAVAFTSSAKTAGQLQPQPDGSFAGPVNKRPHIVDCVADYPPHAVTYRRGEVLSGHLTVTPSRVSSGAAHAITGTLVFTYTPTPAAARLRCHSGQWTLQVRGVAISGTVRPALAVVPQPVTPKPPATAPQSSQPASAALQKAQARRSTIARSLTAPGRVWSWRHSLISLAIAVLAMLLITFPSQLFNRTLNENRDEIRRIVARRFPRLTSAEQGTHARPGRHFAAFALVGVAGAILGGLNDPSFGFSVKSAETLCAVLLSFSVGTAVAGLLGWAYRKLRHLETTGGLHALPAGLLVAGVCVLVSRLTHFQPGYLYGVVAGVAFARKLGRREHGHEAALATLGTMAIAVVAWLAWGPVRHDALHAHAGPAVLIADTLLAGLFVSGVVGTVINLVPLEFMAGGAIVKWHRGAWAAVFTLATFLFVNVLLYPAAAARRTPKASWVTTLVLFLAFGAISVAFHRYFAIRNRRAALAVPAQRPTPPTPPTVPAQPPAAPHEEEPGRADLT